MGKGDRRSKKGKRYRGTYGTARPKTPKPKKTKTGSKSR